MSKIIEFITPSPVHRVILEEGGFTMLPKGEDLESLRAFQAIAKRAYLYREKDYRVTEHYDGDSPIAKAIDTVTFVKQLL